MQRQLYLGAQGDVPIRRRTQPNVASKFGVMSEAPQKRNDRPRHGRVDQEPHVALARGQRMERFLVDQLAGKFQRGADVVNTEIVLALDLFERHAACKAADDGRHGYPRPAYDGLSLADRRVDDDAVRSVHGDTNCIDFRAIGEGTVCLSGQREPTSFAPCLTKASSDLVQEHRIASEAPQALAKGAVAAVPWRERDGRLRTALWE